MSAAALPAVPIPADPQRPRVLLVGTAVAGLASAMTLLGLLAVELSVRAGALAASEPWLPEGAEIPLTPVNMAAFTLLLSVVTMQWAHYAIGNNDRINTYVALGLTIMLGLAYVNSTAYLFTQMNLAVRESSAAVLIYAVTGAHLAMTIAAMVFALVMAFRTLGGQYSGRDREGITAATLYWHLTVGLYLVVWYAVYVTK
jgi:cytochrome c oxidase subunit 3